MSKYIREKAKAGGKMLRERRERQQQMDIVILEEMVPKNHLLRRIDEAVDFSFIHELCAPLYCENNGRPAIDPEVLFRMLMVGYWGRKMSSHESSFLSK